MSLQSNSWQVTHSFLNQDVKVCVRKGLQTTSASHTAFSQMSSSIDNKRRLMSISQESNWKNNVLTLNDNTMTATTRTLRYLDMRIPPINECMVWFKRDFSWAKPNQGAEQILRGAAFCWQYLSGATYWDHNKGKLSTFPLTFKYEQRTLQSPILRQLTHQETLLLKV